MRSYWPPGRGRKKAVDKFTTVQGVAIILLIVAMTMAIFGLWTQGYLNFDIH
jgi:hypothetical protein